MREMLGQDSSPSRALGVGGPGTSLPLLVPLQVSFNHMKRIRKPTQDQGTMVRRYLMALEAPTNWNVKVHAYLDQSDFSVPLHQRVRPGRQPRSHGRGESALDTSRAQHLPGHHSESGALGHHSESAALGHLLSFAPTLRLRTRLRQM